MKKLVSLLLVVVTLLSLSLVGCSNPKGFDYQNLASNYVTFYYDAETNRLYVSLADLDATVSDEEITDSINDALVSAGAYYNKITEGEYFVDYGSTISIRYKGIDLATLRAAGYFGELTDEQIKELEDAEITALLLENEKNEGKPLTKAQVDDLKAFSGGDGSTKDTQLTIGSNQFIEELENGMINIKVGTVYYPVVLTFPEDYTNADLAGKRVVFFVTVNHILEKKPLPENVDYGDKLAIKVQLKLEGDYAQYTDKYTGLTIETDKDGKYKKDEDGNYLYKEEQLITELANSTKFLVGLKLNFNGVSEDNPDNAHFAETPIEERFGVPFVFTYDDSVEVSENGETVKKDIKVTAYVTVLSIHSIRYFTTEDIGTEKFSFEDFCEAMGMEPIEEEGEESEGEESEGEKVKKYEFETYEEYLEEVRKNMQLERDVQIKANRLQGAFNALLNEDQGSTHNFSKVDLSSEEMIKLQQDYIAEVRGNIDYFYTQAQATGMLSTYEYMASYYKLKDAKEYIMYSTYGYKYDTIDDQIVTDAKEYVTERLVFWAYVAKEGIVLTEPEYLAGLEEYKEMYGSDTFMEDNNISEEAIREALLWDKAMNHLADTYCDFHYFPAAGEDDHVNHDH